MLDAGEIPLKGGALPLTELLGRRLRDLLE
jgi:hypothetical protein